MIGPVNYPIRFDPIFKERLWGWRRLQSVLGKRLPPEKLIGESWEISDQGDQPSVIANGPLRGHTLRDVMRESPESLFGSRPVSPPSRPNAATPRFPLLVKWIDAREKLSIQVHPPDGHPRLPAGESGKTECWYVWAAEPGAEIYLGLRRGIDRAALVHELARGTVDRCLNTFPASPGDFFFVPAGTPHTIGAGVLLAEIQQTSDTTFRLFDWNRIDPKTSRPRDLQLEPAIDCINFDEFSLGPGIRRMDMQADFMPLLAADRCDYFNVSKRRVSESRPIGGPGHCTVLVGLGGTGDVSGGGETVRVACGDCVLLPACGEFGCDPKPRLEFLEAQLPHATCSISEPAE